MTHEDIMNVLWHVFLLLQLNMQPGNYIQEGLKPRTTIDCDENQASKQTYEQKEKKPYQQRREK